MISQIIWDLALFAKLYPRTAAIILIAISAARQYLTS
jgi:hypothetical protein